MKQDVYFNKMHKLLSCEYIYYRFKNYIVCFFNDNPTIGITSYEIQNNNNNKINIIYFTLNKASIYSPGLENASNHFFYNILM
jgi:hypothetical protein